ncbi:DUF5010 domain-containing protein [Bythopirellula goksoeyrii]|uniref:Uncharacterized protein n=1 Tax=Bythopirellula goksoeyrii TaxID=1400387 RepID=A0A5B9QFN5_9BACT|nr:DUF5010 domain-containing protein [Bythopirellula goksoeyrii]QEG36372.1 hypothetical protein Pr1d_36860 [Bythopirellula goksoeyrii]
MIRCFQGTLPLYLLLGFTGVCRADPTVGVYYYPWWGAGQGGHTFDQTLRAHTTPNTQLPAVGPQYSSRDANVISAHIDQSHLGNISMWSMSWWGPNSYENQTIRNNILPHPRASELSYTIHYETGGRLGNHNNPNYSNLIPDFQYLATNIFSDPNYMRIDGRPVVVMYLSRVFFDDAAGATALNNMRTTMQNQYGYDPYIIGDHLFNSVSSGVANMDAITSFDVYGQVFGDGVVNQAKIDQLDQIYSSAKNVANNAGVAFVPGLAPGYNDKAVRPGHPPAARYFPSEPFGSAMEAMLQDAVLPNTDVNINDLILVNSFNEWHEDTQIEASVIGPATNTDDTPGGMELTEGRFYEGYGNKYLDILRNATQAAPTTPAEIRWGRGTATGMFVGNYTDLANWNADDVTPDPPRIPGPSDRARVDRSGTDMTFNSTIIANDFLFGVDEAGQTFNLEAGADVTLASNLFVSFNSGDIGFDVQTGASLIVGGNFLLGQHDGKQNGQQFMNDEDITVTIAGMVDNIGDVILGDRYGLLPATTSMDVDVLLDVTTGTLRTSDIKFAPNGDLSTYLAPANSNTMGIQIGDDGLIVIVGSDSTAKINNLIADGLLYTNSATGTIQVSYDGTDTLVQVVLAGDFDGDGDVDGADFQMWQRNPGVGNLSDWQNNYGVTGAQTALNSVPEPTTLVLMLASALILSGSDRRQNM